MTSKSRRKAALRRRAILASAAVILIAGTAGTAVAIGRRAPSPPSDSDVQKLGDTSDQCPPVGEPVTLKYLAAHGLESPRLPNKLAEQAVVKSVTCHGNQDGITGIDLNISAIDEDFRHYSIIFISGGPNGHDPSEIIDSLEAGLGPEGDTGDESSAPEKVGLIRVDVGSSSILAIDPGSRLADLVDPSSPSDSYTSIESLRWENGTK